MRGVGEAASVGSSSAVSGSKLSSAAPASGCAELAALAENTFGDMIKCVADVRLGSLALDAELHADLERLLLENGSAEEDLWGFNLYPDIREAIKRLVEQFIIG